MKFKAIVFDLDGTLLDTIGDISNSANNILERHGFPTHSFDKYRYFVGDGVPKLIERVLPGDGFSDKELRGYVREFLEEYDQHWKVLSRPYPGIPEMLDEMSRRDLKLAVLSNKPNDSTQMCVKEMLGNWSFDIVQGLSETIPPKPDPAGALMIAGSLGVPPEQMVFLGDTAVDMKTSVATGMFPVGALWGFRTEDELRSAGAKVLLNKPQELSAVVGSADAD
ncbi:HAD family hydrolase [Thermodesulfobacteriota bacterium]